MLLPGILIYKYLPYALGRQEYVLEPPCGICMLFAQRLLFAPPFVVSFPGKVNVKKMCSTRKYPIHLLPRYNLLTHPYILLPAFNFNGQSSKKQLLSLPTHEAYD